MDKRRKLILIGVIGLTFLAMAYLYVAQFPNSSTPKTEIAVDKAEEAAVQEEEIDATSGFIAKGDYKLVIANCTPCHSSKLVIQNRASREGWLEMIRWMQETQKLWDLQDNEDKILDYLATYYAPEEEGRRKPLEVEEWYTIE